jgi:hypothetical protein
VENLQIVLTPGSQKKDMPSKNLIIPNLQIDAEESLENVKLNKQGKKALKSKKKLNSHRIIDEPLKTSLINTGKKKRKKFHGRLKTYNSKSTVTTRETNFSDKKINRGKFKKQKSNNIYI